MKKWVSSIPVILLQTSPLLQYWATSFSSFQTPPCSMTFLRPSLHCCVNMKGFIENWSTQRLCLYLQMCIIVRVLSFSDPVVAFGTWCCTIAKMGGESIKRSVSLCNDHGFPLDLQSTIRSLRNTEDERKNNWPKWSFPWRTQAGEIILPPHSPAGRLQLEYFLSPEINEAF